MLQSVTTPFPFRKASPIRQVDVCISSCPTGRRHAISFSRDSDFAFFCARSRFSSGKRLLASSRLSVRVRQIGSHWMDFSEI